LRRDCHPKRSRQLAGLFSFSGPGDSIIAGVDSIDPQARQKNFARKSFFPDSFLGLRI
jgi:hypothetical protein